MQEGCNPFPEEWVWVWAGLAWPCLPPCWGWGQAGSGGWAGAEMLARPSSCRRNSELASGWLPGTSGAGGPLPPPTPPPRLWPALPAPSHGC